MPLQVHHVKPKNKGGTDKLSNMVTLCVDCHKKIHSGEIELSKKSLKYWTEKEYKYVLHINSMKNRIVSELRKLFDEVQVTFGNITKAVRKKLNLEKSDVNDSIAVAFQDLIDNNAVSKLSYTFIQKCAPKGRYRLHRGKRSEVEISTDSSHYFGFSQWDKVELPDGTLGFVKGRRNSGTFAVSDIFGNLLTEITYNKLKIVSKAETMMMGVRSNSPPR